MGVAYRLKLSLQSRKMGERAVARCVGEARNALSLARMAIVSGCYFRECGRAVGVWRERLEAVCSGIAQWGPEDAPRDGQ